MRSHEDDMVNGATRFSLSPEALARRIGDDIVILDFPSGSYFGLDAVGARIWDLMGEGKTIDEICDALVQEYDVSIEQVRRDALSLVVELSEKGLIKAS